MPESSTSSPWLTSPDQVAAASEASLRRTLLTVDGAGVKVKGAALEELIRRAVMRDREETVGAVLT